MSWDPSEHEWGVDRGVFYPISSPGQAWNGLSAIKEIHVDADVNTRYMDGQKFNQRRPLGSFAGTIEAFNYPSGFYDDILSQRRPPTFGLSYRTGFSENWKLHLVYNLKISPVGILRQTSETDKWGWGFTTISVDVPFAVRSAHIVVDTSKAYSWTVTELEDILYGTESSDPRLPLPDELYDLFESNGILRITDNGDGTWTADTDEDGIITMLDADTFEITWPSAIYIDADSYNISTL